jgi:protein arginine N-methyltransferase 1
MNYEPSEEPGFADHISWPVSSHLWTNFALDSSNHFSHHEELLKDKERTRTFKKAIMRNKYLFKGKVVLELGCGTGLLSIFASKAGARQVFAVDSPQMIRTAAEIASENNIKNITFIEGKVEEISLPIVDIIIFDWMGYFLINNAKLESLVYARNKWLVPDGLIFPNKVKLYLAGIEDAKFIDEKFEFWNDVYGIDMNLMRKISLREGHVEEISSDAILSTSSPIFEADLMRLELSDLDFISSYELQFTRNDFMHGLMSWFDVSFTNLHKTLSISTSPRSKLTRWKQTVFYLENSQPVSVGQILTGSVAVKRNESKGLMIKISFNVESTQYPLNTTQYYSLTI